MNSAQTERLSGSFGDADLEARRQRILRGLRRANTAGAVILVIVIGLSLAALIQALRAERNARQTREASAKGEQQLWQARLAQAGAQRLSGLAGRKKEGLAAIASAAAIKPSLELRNEAIATLALTDVSDAGIWRPARVHAGELLAFSPNLDQYAVGNGARKITLHRTGTGETITSFEGPAAMTDDVTFSPDGDLIAAAFGNGDVVLWRLGDQSQWWTLNCPRAYPLSVDFSVDAHLLAVTAGKSQVQLLDVATRAELSPLSVQGLARSAAFRPDGKMLAVAVTNRLELWSWPERSLVRSLAHAGEVVTFAWSPDSRRIASSSRSSSDVQLWDVQTGRQRVLSGHTELVPHLAFDPRGQLLASFSWDGSTRFWQGSDGEFVFLSRAGFAQEFNRDGSGLTYSREQQGFGLWNIDRSAVYRELTLPIGAAPYITGFDFSPDSRTLAIINSEGLHVFDMASLTDRSFVELANPLSVWFGDDNRLTTISRRSIAGWRMSTARDSQWVVARDFDLPSEAVLDFGTMTRGSPSLVAAPTADNVFWFSTKDPRVVHRLNGRGMMGPLTGAAISPDTNWIATTYWKGGGTAVWDAHTDKKAKDLGRNGGYVAFSPDGHWLLVGSAHNYALWETTGWTKCFEFDRQTTGELLGGAAFSPDNQLLAICPEVNQIQLIALPGGEIVATLNSPISKNIGSLAFSPDNSTLAAATFDNRLQLWNLPAIHKELAKLSLDWEANGNSAPARREPGPSHEITAASATPSALTQKSFYWFDGLGVLIAMFIGLYTLRYHQKLVRNYEEVEEAVAQRNRELKVAQLELLHSQKMKALGTLAAGVAHDFNNLLSVIRMGNQLQSRPDTSFEDKAESARAVERAVDQGKKVVKSMLGYSRESGEASQAFSMPEVVDQVVLLLNKQFLGGLTLTLELNRNIPVITGVRGRMEQILLNLVVNAAEAMEGKGRLLIAVRETSQVSYNGALLLRPRPAPKYVELVVADTGPGIDPRVRERIFEPFFSTKPQSASSGTGLGLSLVHSLAEQEGMGIALESEPGKGTSFVLLIPIQEGK